MSFSAFIYLHLFTVTLISVIAAVCNFDRYVHLECADHTCIITRCYTTLLSLYLYQVFDGDNIHFPLVGTFCGTSMPSYFISTGNILTVHFITDSSVQRRGFNASYSAVPCKIRIAF